MKIALFVAVTALVAGAACSSSSSDSNGGPSEADSDAAADASGAVGPSSDGGAPRDSGVPHDSGTPVDSGLAHAGDAPDGGCAFESVATETSAMTCFKNILESCGGSQFVLDCDCTTNTCSCKNDGAGTTYATFTPPAELCADTQADGGCKTTTGLAADAKTYCGIY